MKKINYLSLASIISSFAVVMLHTNEVFGIYSQEPYWITANIIESVMYFAVPVFFMISGVTLIDYRERYTTKQYIMKRVQKTFIPFVFWSIVGIVYLSIIGQWEIDLSIDGVITAINSIFNINILSIFWFFGPLFGIYLSIPFISSVAKEVRIRSFNYIILVTFIFNSFIPFVCKIFNIAYAGNIIVPVGSGYIIYVLLGYILHNVRIEKRQKLCIYVLAIVGVLLHIIGTQYLSFQAGTIIQTYKGYLNVPCIMYSMGVFLFFRDIGESIHNDKAIKILNEISSYTFAIYLLHWFVINMLVKIFNIDIFSLAYRVGAPFVIYIICIGITWFIRKIPILCKTVP